MFTLMISLNRYSKTFCMISAADAFQFSVTIGFASVTKPILMQWLCPTASDEFVAPHNHKHILKTLPLAEFISDWDYS